MASCRAASSIVARSVGVRSQFMAAPAKFTAQRSLGQRAAARRDVVPPNELPITPSRPARDLGPGAEPVDGGDDVVRLAAEPRGQRPVVLDSAELGRHLLAPGAACGVAVAAAVREEHGIAPRREDGRRARPAEVAGAGVNGAPVVHDQARERARAWRQVEVRGHDPVAARDLRLDRHHPAPRGRLGLRGGVGVGVGDQDEALEPVDQRRHPGADGAELGALPAGLEVLGMRRRIREGALPGHVGALAPGIGLGEDPAVWQAKGDPDLRRPPPRGEDLRGATGLGVVVRALDEHGRPQAVRLMGSGSGK